MEHACVLNADDSSGIRVELQDALMSGTLVNQSNSAHFI